MNVLFFLRKKNKVSYSLTDSEIKACINLLPKDYQFDFCDINIYSNKFSYIKAFGFRFVKFTLIQLEECWHIIRGQTLGCCGNYDYVDLYNFNLQPNKYIKVVIVFNLYHELRHLWQRHHKYIKYSHDNLPVTDKYYLQQPVERDANRFAARMINKHHSQISKILNVDDSWDCFM